MAGNQSIFTIPLYKGKIESTSTWQCPVAREMEWIDEPIESHRVSSRPKSLFAIFAVIIANRFERWLRRTFISGLLSCRGTFCFAVRGNCRSSGGRTGQ